MTRNRLTLLSDTARLAEPLNSHVQMVLASWADQDQPQITQLTLDDAIADPSRLDQSAVVWLLLDRSQPGALFEIIGQLQERHLPALLTCRDDTAACGSMVEDGVVICPPSTEPHLVHAMLVSLFSMTPILSALRSELNLLRAHEGGLCNQIGKMDEELRLAAQLQRQFLPRELPCVNDIEFRVLWRPAGYVSGDIYDVIRLDENHIGFFIADAVGHGVPAALMTMYIKRSLKTKILDHKESRGYRLIEPAQTLALLNQDLIDQNAGGQIRFATACYGVINCHSRQVTLARGGHPFPMLLRASGQTESLDPEGGLLGVFPQEFEQLTFDLAPGDRLLLYSDGFELAFPKTKTQPHASHEDLNAYYLHELEGLRRGSVDEALRGLQKRLDSQSGSLNQRDDLTVLCLCLSPTPSGQADEVLADVAAS